MLDFVAYPLIEPSWLAAHLADGDIRVVDARWRGDGTSRELYRQGHLPGAVHLETPPGKNGARTRPCPSNGEKGSLTVDYHGKLCYTGADKDKCSSEVCPCAQADLFNP